ncbi:MAG: phosphomethylpyrimidine synthase ThiC [Candidatus Omnitrophica bacterium]|nr:phosphomethylpyrimidine synthase ThiC [Candidatus Omnitrophota bacterium]
MTILQFLKQDLITPLVKKIAQTEEIELSLLKQLLLEGKVVICKNKLRQVEKPSAIGKGLRIKVNANIGTSTDKISLKKELEKLKVAISSGADTVMDLSVAGNLSQIRKEILSASSVPVGTVPLYEVAARAKKRYGNFLFFDKDDLLEVLEEQAKDGVDFFTIHAGVTQRTISVLKQNPRLLGIVSRGGAIMAAWMQSTKKENPFYVFFDKVIEIAQRYDITLSLGDGLRPGSVLDATDKAQVAELKILTDLVKRCRQNDVQVIVEGPGHVPLSEIQKNIILEKKLCGQVPFYVLGPLVTDICPGYDHINAAIGAALAGWYGADFICYVTPAEHLRHPSCDDVREGVIAARIAAHAADIARGRVSSLKWDEQISKARAEQNWRKQIKLALDPIKARKYRISSMPGQHQVCTMCGQFCSIKIVEQCFKNKPTGK